MLFPVIKFLKFCITPVLLVSLVLSNAYSADHSEERIAQLEARLIKLEARLERSEEATKKLRALVEAQTDSAAHANATTEEDDSTSTHTVNKVWHNPRWMQKALWDKIYPGTSIHEVLKLLGPPPRSLNSLKPGVDKVFYYQTGFQKNLGSLRGKISFRKGRVLTVKKPDFN